MRSLSNIAAAAHKIILEFRDTEDGKFAAKTINNVCWFVAFGLVALAVKGFVAWLEHSGGGTLAGIFAVVEYAIVAADVVWFMCRLAVDANQVIVRAYLDVRAAWREASSQQSPTIEKPSVGAG